MAGYKVGIAVVLLLLAVVAGIAVYALWPSGLGQASSHTMRSRFLQAIRVHQSMGALAPPTTRSGAGHLYMKAYNKLVALSPDADSLDNARHNTAPEKDPQLMKIVTLLEQAATRSIGRKHLVFSATIPIPAVDDPVADRISALGDICSTAGAGLMIDGKPHAAEKALQACAVFGQRVWRRGLLVSVRGNGLGAMEFGVQGLEQLYKKGHPLANPEKYSQCEKLHRAIAAATKRWFAKLGFVCVTDPRAANMVYMVKHDKDLSWRIAAIMELGVARWATDYSPRADAIKHYLNQRTLSPNKWIRRAAKRAAGMTLQDIRMAS